MRRACGWGVLLFLTLVLPAWSFEEEMPGEFWDMESALKVPDAARKLSLYSYGNRSELPIEIGLLTNLTCLLIDAWGEGQDAGPMISGNLTNLTGAIGRLDKLTELRVTGCPVTGLPPEIGLLKRLKTLALDRTRISVFPDEIGDLEHLTELRVSVAPELRRLPRRVTDMRSLEKMIIFRAELESLPEDIDKLKQLRCLEVERNSIKALPVRIGGLANLEELRAGANAISVIPSEIGQLKKLKDLALQANTLERVPAELAELRHLERLSLCGNPLREFPAVITNMVGLRTLELSYCALATIPQGIANLVELELLDLSSNHLTAFPDLRRLRNLKSLLCRDCGLTRFPSTITNLVGLEEIILSGNDLATLPDFRVLTNLKQLDVCDNARLTEEMIRNVRRAMPRCEVRWYPPKANTESPAGTSGTNRPSIANIADCHPARLHAIGTDKDAAAAASIIDGGTVEETVVLGMQELGGKTLTNSLGMEFVAIAGMDVMFCKWETRVQDFEAFVKETGYDATKGMVSFKDDSWEEDGHSWKNPGFPHGPTHPVCGVNWSDAQAFCEWLTKKERAAGVIGPNQSYRLPADWEWSTAIGLNEARAGDPKEKDAKIPNIYPWGAGWPPPPGAGNYGGEEAGLPWKIDGYHDGYPRTAPVGSFEANRNGLYDMGGNVWEWCEDFYSLDVPMRMRSRVLRGACFSDFFQEALLSSRRNDYTPFCRSDRYGFRCVMVF